MTRKDNTTEEVCPHHLCHDSTVHGLFRGSAYLASLSLSSLLKVFCFVNYKIKIFLSDLLGVLFNQWPNISLTCPKPFIVHLLDS